MKSSITVICGHYGCGKTNLVLNLAAEAAQRGRRSVVVDMDVVNPYFRSSDYSALLKKLGVELIAPVFANTTLDTPVLPPEIFSIFNMENADIFIDAGGDDVGATALGQLHRQIETAGYEMLYVVNRVSRAFHKAGRNASAPSGDRNGIAPESDGNREQFQPRCADRYANGA